jgi:SSS family solute:Na+ symporter
MGLLFLAMTAIILAVRYVRPRPAPSRLNLHKRAVDTTPWKYGPASAVFLFSLLIFVYVLCSPIGVASHQGLAAPFYITTGTLLIITLILVFRLTVRRPPP